MCQKQHTYVWYTQNSFIHKFIQTSRDEISYACRKATDDDFVGELEFYQKGNHGGFLRNFVKIATEN